MDYNKVKEGTVKDLLDSHQGRANLLTQYILYDVLDPEGEISITTQFEILHEASLELASIKEDGYEDRFINCVTNLFERISREDFQPEMQVLFFKTIQSISKSFVNLNKELKTVKVYNSLKKITKELI